MPRKVPKLFRYGAYSPQLVAMVVIIPVSSIWKFSEHWDGLFALLCALALHFSARVTKALLKWCLNWHYFISDVILGGFTGPLYLVLTMIPKLRKSTEWYFVGNGPNCVAK